MIAKVHIETEHRNGRTILKDLFCAPPFRIADISGKRPIHLRMMQMSASPGILDGDSFHFNIRLKENSVASLETQAYQRLYRMKEGAEQCIDIALEENAFFEYLPHPTVPHAGTRFKSSTRILMSESSRLVFGEIYTCGRSLCSESFQFHKIHSAISIRLGSKLILKELMVLEPNESLTITGMMEGFTHQGSLFIIDPKMKLDDFIAHVRNEVLTENSFITRINDCGLAVRVMGLHAEPLFELFKIISERYKSFKVHGQ